MCVLWGKLKFLNEADFPSIAYYLPGSHRKTKLISGFLKSNPKNDLTCLIELVYVWNAE